MGEIEVSFTGPERELLVALLEKELRDTRVEERHTDFSPDFQAEVKQEEVLLRRMIEKLRPTVV